MESFESGHVQAKNDLELGIAEREGVLAGRAVYAADLYDGSTIQRLVDHVWRVLEAGTKDAEQNVNEIDLLSAAEQSQVLQEFNQTEAELPAVMVHQAFEFQVEHAPEAEAVEYDGVRWTYGKLNRHANQLAHYLKKQGVGPEVRVGVYMERDLKMVMALVGILKAGGVYVPLDPGYPADRLAFMMQDANAPVVITGKATLPLEMQNTHARVVALEKDWDEVLCEPEDNPESPVESKNLAYVTYTSGSTGRPKGAMITHDGLLNHVCAKIADLALDAQDVVAQNSPSSFDISIWQVLAILLVGGRVYVMNDDTIRSAQEMLRETEEPRNHGAGDGACDAGNDDRRARAGRFLPCTAKPLTMSILPRRTVAFADVRPMARTASACNAGEWIWRDRMLRRRYTLPYRRAAARWTALCSVGFSADEYHDLCFGSQPARSSSWSSGRVVYGRGRRRSRLSEPARAYGGKIHPESL